MTASSPAPTFTTRETEVAVSFDVAGDEVAKVISSSKELTAQAIACVNAMGDTSDGVAVACYRSDALRLAEFHARQCVRLASKTISLTDDQCSIVVSALAPVFRQERTLAAKGFPSSHEANMAAIGEIVALMPASQRAVWVELVAEGEA